MPEWAYIYGGKNRNAVDNDGSPDMAWCKALRSTADGECVEVGTVSEIIVVRDSRDRKGPGLCFDRQAWEVFLVRVKDDNPRRASGAYRAFPLPHEERNKVRV